MAYQTYKVTWNNIEIEARYDPAYATGIIAHLELQAIKPERARLPMTETGYRSHFHPIGTIERDFNGDVIEAVKHWLEEEAKSSSWQDHIENSRQGCLFEF